MDRTPTTEDAAGVRSRPPHMQQRPGETPQQYRDRLSRSCYRCGRQIHDQGALAAHEDRCDGGHW